MRDARALIADGTISGGMIPKVETCLEALENGLVEGVVILNGKTPHVVLVELFTEHGAGTLIVALELFGHGSKKGAQWAPFSFASGFHRHRRRRLRRGTAVACAGPRGLEAGRSARSPARS